ncbi:plasmid partitioning protein RepB [Roseibium aggregatum]|nr:plasmid partitioning protein RepB [Roseibium aggregatum]
MTSSSDRSKKMKALFGGVDPKKLDIPNATAPKNNQESRRVSSGTVKSMQGAFSAIEQENEELRQKLDSMEAVVELDPTMVDSSPYRDRFENDQEASDALDELKISIKGEGQRIPVLVRPHPTEPGRFQLAYGHRRTAAIQSLHEEAEDPDQVRLKAYIRDLSDAELIKEQSLENAVRENLSWIELAVWAQQLRSTGLKYADMEPILGIAKTGISRLLNISEKIPNDIARAIGRAKGVGRPKWQSLADALSEASAEKRVRAILERTDFVNADGSERIAKAITAAKGKAKKPEKPQTFNLKSGDKVFAKVKQTSKETLVSIPKDESGFGEWLTENMSELREQYMSNGSKKPGR